jgi:hypothetical protein
MIPCAVCALGSRGEDPDFAEQVEHLWDRSEAVGACAEVVVPI